MNGRHSAVDGSVAERTRSRDGSSEPRALTAVERTYVVRRDRGGRRMLLFFAAIALAMTAFLWYSFHENALPAGAPVTAVHVVHGAAYAIMLGIAAVNLYFGLRRPAPAAVSERRVGRYGGVHGIAGRPTYHFVGDVTVVLPAGWSGPPVFGLMQYVEVEFTPALEDVPNPSTARLVLAAVGEDGTRLRVDPGAPWRLPDRAPEVTDTEPGAGRSTSR